MTFKGNYTKQGAPVYDKQLITNYLIALRSIFKKPSEEDWISIEKLKKSDVFLKDFSLVIMLKFLNTSTVRIAGEDVNSGVDSQRLKGKNMYISGLILQSQFIKYQEKLMVRAKTFASQSNLVR